MQEKKWYAFGTREVVYAALGAALYGVLSFATNMLALPAAGNVALRPAVCIPMFFGVAFGPWVGFISGFLGNIIGDALSGWGFWFWWDLGNGIMGLIPGFAGLFIRDFRSTRSLVIADVLSALGVVVGMLLASLSEMWVSGVDFSTAIVGYFVPSALTDLVNGLALVPILMVAYSAIAVRTGR
ncbi:MAG: ECF transporter S component [Thermoflexia bacterium]|nr:MAG: ECF transporter S component [Thermoflexia bacterium]